jgi:metal-responsive CopG/Arc/MetJ family transcriptional regulator
MERLSITLEDELKQQLDTQVPKGERARFVANAIRNALEEKKKQQALDYLLAFETYSSHQDSTEILQEIREERTETVYQRSTEQ